MSQYHVYYCRLWLELGLAKMLVYVHHSTSCNFEFILWPAFSDTRDPLRLARSIIGGHIRVDQKTITRCRWSSCSLHCSPITWKNQQEYKKEMK